MKIKVKNLQGLTETAMLQQRSSQISHTTIGVCRHWYFGCTLMVTVDLELRTILYADRSVVVIHQYQGLVQQFRGIPAAAEK